MRIRPAFAPTITGSSIVLAAFASFSVLSFSPAAVTTRKQLRTSHFPESSSSGFFVLHSTMSSSPTSRCGIDYPELVVFDADACLWDQEMFEMPQLPTGTVTGPLGEAGEGVVGVMSGPYEIRLHAGSLKALQDHAKGTVYPGMKACIASSADTPKAEKIARATLKLLEVVPGLTVWDLLVGRDWDGIDVNQIGRQPPLSSNKARSHFPRLREATGIRYDKMLFFDDCNWGDHCGMVAAACREEDTGKGPATVRTPNGLGLKEWQRGLEVYRKHAEQD